MSKLLRYLCIEHDFEHDFENIVKKKKKYSEAKVHFANDDLSKRWYVYFSFRKSENGSLERYPNNIYSPQHLNKKVELIT